MTDPYHVGRDYRGSRYGMQADKVVLLFQAMLGSLLRPHLENEKLQRVIAQLLSGGTQGALTYALRNVPQDDIRRAHLLPLGVERPLALVELDAKSKYRFDTLQEHVDYQRIYPIRNIENTLWIEFARDRGQKVKLLFAVLAMQLPRALLALGITELLNFDQMEWLEREFDKIVPAE